MLYTTTGFQALVDSDIFVFDGDTFVEKKPKEVTDDLSIDCTLESTVQNCERSFRAHFFTL